MDKVEKQAVLNYLAVSEELVSVLTQRISTLTHQIRQLEQRADAAIGHLREARDAANGGSGCVPHICAAIDVLIGEAG